MHRFIIATLFISLSFAAGAQSTDAPDIADYAWGFPIRIPGTATFYSVELPLQVNQSVTDAELRDAGVYNGDGIPVTHLFAPASDNGEATERSSALPMLPLYVSGRADEGQITLQREGDSTQFRFDLEDLLAPAEGERLVSYIVDARKIEDNAVALDFAWPQIAPGFMGWVTVEGGNDLQNWHAAGAAVIADLRENAARIVQRRVHLSRGDYDYLRIRWEGMPDGWRLSQALGVYVDAAVEPAWKFTTLQSTGVDPADGGRLFELGGAPTVDEVQVILPVPNTIISARVYYWSVTGKRWLLAGQGSIHHIVRDDYKVMNDPLAIGNTRTSQFKVVITRGLTNTAMQLKVAWRPDSLLFLAQGQAPFTLVAGNAYDEAEKFPQHRIYSDRSLLKLAEDNGSVRDASLGRRYILGGPERLVVSKPTDWRTLALWLALLAGVAFVGFMASKTIRELKSQN